MIQSKAAFANGNWQRSLRSRGTTEPLRTKAPTKEFGTKWWSTRFTVWSPNNHSLILLKCGLRFFFCPTDPNDRSTMQQIYDAIHENNTIVNLRCHRNSIDQKNNWCRLPETKTKRVFNKPQSSYLPNLDFDHQTCSELYVLTVYTEAPENHEHLERKEALVSKVGAFEQL